MRTDLLASIGTISLALASCTGSGGASDETAMGSSSSAGDQGSGSAPADSSGATSRDTDDTSRPSTGEPVSDPLALLQPGPHLGMIVGFEAPAPGTEATVAAHWDDALAAGMDVGRVQVDWADLEPEPGVFNLEDLTAQLDALQADGLQAMVTLSTIDSLEYTLPDDLMDPGAGLILAGGMAFDDAIVTGRFAELLDVVVPAVVSRGGFLIAVGNEPDNAFEDNPEFASEVAGFTAAARAHAATIEPDLAIGMTLGYASVDTYEVSQLVLDTVEVAVFNMYCQGDDGLVLPTEMIGPRIEAMLEVAGDKPVVVQELGCPAGIDDSGTINGSPERQAAYFETVAQHMVADPQLRVAFVFQMLDWSPSLTQLFVDELLALGFGQDVADSFAESLSTMGLCRWDDASCRPAWDSVLTAIQTLAAAR